jgi:hypothetical protein
MPRTLTASNRSALIRFASTLPVGSPERKAILTGLRRTAALGTHVNLQGIIEGYKEGTTMMFGPLVPVATWAKAMLEGLAPEDTYNGFSVATVARWLKGMGVEAVHPAREGSVAIYFPLPPGADLTKLFRGRPAKADEVSTYLGKPDGQILDANWAVKSLPRSLIAAMTQEAIKAGQQVYVRMWWD